MGKAPRVSGYSSIIMSSFKGQLPGLVSLLGPETLELLSVETLGGIQELSRSRTLKANFSKGHSLHLTEAVPVGKTPSISACERGKGCRTEEKLRVRTTWRPDSPIESGGGETHQ